MSVRCIQIEPLLADEEVIVAWALVADAVLAQGSGGVSTTIPVTEVVEALLVAVVAVHIALVFAASAEQEDFRVAVVIGVSLQQHGSITFVSHFMGGGKDGFIRLVIGREGLQRGAEAFLCLGVFFFRRQLGFYESGHGFTIAMPGTDCCHRALTRFAVAVKKVILRQFRRISAASGIARDLAG